MLDSLRAIRTEAGMSQKRVADLVGISQASYCNLENGKRHPSVAVAKKIGAALGFDWTRLFDDQEPAGERENG